MSLFGYPATVIHHKAVLDDWGRVVSRTSISLNAKVVEEQKLVRTIRQSGAQGTYQAQDVQSSAEIHLEGLHTIGFSDHFEYENESGQTIVYDVLHVEIRKQLGTDDTKKVIVYV